MVAICVARRAVLTPPMRVVLPVRRPSSRRPLISVLHFIHSLRSPVVYRRPPPPRIRRNLQLCFFKMGYTVPSSLGDWTSAALAHNSGKDFFPACNADSWHLLAKAAGSTALASRRAGTQSWEQILPLVNPSLRCMPVIAASPAIGGGKVGAHDWVAPVDLL
jgi:hypothetical protein